MKYQLRKHNKHNEYYIVVLKRGEAYHANGTLLNSFELFDNVVVEGTEKEVYSAYLNKIIG